MEIGKIELPKLEVLTLYKPKAKNKGFTVLELLLTLGIASIFLVIMFNFFLSHNEYLSKTEKRSQLQTYMQILSDSFRKSAMESSQVSAISGIIEGGSTTANNLNISDAVKINRIAFKSKYSDVDLGTMKDYVLEYDFSIADSDNKFIINKSINNLSDKRQEETNSKEIACHINSIVVKPLNKNNSPSTYADCPGIDITIELASKDGQVKYSSSFKVYFRSIGDRS